MKSFLKISLIGAAVLTGKVSAQVIIGNATGTAANKTSVLLEFANTNDRGLVLPYVRTKAATPTEGSIILDASNPADARVKYFNGSWVDLSGQGGNVTAVLASQPTAVAEGADAKTVIGARTSTVTDGVLVLESATKAMVLPQVDSVDNIKSPSPGMMVFVRTEGSERLAVYNGSQWSFWKP